MISGALFTKALDDLRRDSNCPVFSDLERHRGGFSRATGHTADGVRDVTVCCSNDYPGMGQHSSVIAAMHGKEQALQFTSGCVSNGAALGTLAARIPGCIVYCDALNHASMIERIRHSRAVA